MQVSYSLENVGIRELNLMEIDLVSGAEWSWVDAGAATTGGAVAGGVVAVWTGPGILAGAGLGALGGFAGYAGAQAFYYFA